MEVQLDSSEQVDGDLKTESEQRCYDYDEAVELTGNGRYNYLLLTACSIISNAVALDMFGFGIVVAASYCDLRLGIKETGALASVPFAGLLFAFPWGYYADTRGRRRALLLSTSVGFTMAALSSFSPTWESMMAVKFVGCCFSTAAFTITITYLGESTSSKYRSRYLFIMNSVNLASEAVSFILAYFILPLQFNIMIPWLYITFRPWRLLTLLMAVPLGIGALMIFFLHESPKFLANKRDGQKALNILRSIYALNGGSDEYPVKCLKCEKDVTKQPFWSSIARQTVPIFRPPLLWRTLQLFYLITICCSTNNVFLMWFPTMVNSFFKSLEDGTAEYDINFCERITRNVTSDSANILNGTVCNDVISDSTIYSGIIYGVIFLVLNLMAAVFAAWRRLVLLAVLLVSAVSGLLVNTLTQPIVSMIAYTLLQGTSIGIGISGSYFVDLYPTSHRGLVSSLGLMLARIASFGGVNLMGAIIINHCALTFYSWSVFVLSGVLITLFLPSDKKTYK